MLNLPVDELMPEDRSAKMFTLMDTNKDDIVSLDKFINGRPINLRSHYFMYMPQYMYTTMYSVMCAHFMFGTDITVDFIVTKGDHNSGYSETTI